MDPKVSIMLTSYNHAPFLRQAIESILNQTYTEFELVIYDDCSTDNSWEIICEYAQKDSRIRAILAKVNGKKGRLRKLLPEFKGEYVAIAHSDDVWDINKLEAQVAYLDAHPETGGCFTRVQVIDDDDNIVPNHPYQQAFLPENRNRFEWLRFFFFHGNALCHPSSLIRKKSYESYPLLARGLGGLPDFYKWIELCLHEEIHIVDEPYLSFRVHGDGSNESARTLDGEHRVQIEWVFVLREYLKMVDMREFLQVFPEAQRYQVGEVLCVPFALAQLCLTEINREPHHLFGIQVIYDLFQDDEQRELLESVYHYTDKEFSEDKKKYDYVGNVGSTMCSRAVLYVDTGSGFSDATALSQEVLSTTQGTVSYEWDLTSVQGSIKALRFDPVDGEVCSCRVVSAQVDDSIVGLSANNAFHSEGWDDFASLDPQYAVDFAGEAKRLVVVLEHRPWDLTRHIVSNNAQKARSRSLWRRR